MSLKLKKVRLPNSTLFAEQISTLISWCNKQKPGKNKPRVKSVADLQTACATIVEGLYQAWSAVGKTVDLEMALSPQYYHSTAPAKINHLSHYFVTLALDGLVALGWVRVKKGFQRAGVNEVTRVRASGTLFDAFTAAGCQWLELKPAGEVIFLRDKDSVTGERIALIAPNTQKVRAMRRNLQKINEFIGKQAICLHMTNQQLATVKLYKVGEEAPPSLIFNYTGLYRVFSRGSMTKGGRFYGGWWQHIRSDYRPYLTINGMPTSEIDYSELHPRFLYERFGLPPPSEDLYDDGWRDPNVPYDEDVEPYKARRKLFKAVFNVMLNSEKGGYRFAKKARLAAKKLNLTAYKIKKILLKKHPVLLEVLNTGIGLEFQYMDSQIAERVMLRLLAKGIPCLPVHDSFIVDRESTQELHQTMDEAYSALMGGSAKLKPLKRFQSGFQLTLTPAGDVGKEALHKMHQEAVHNHFVTSRRNQLVPVSPAA
jgi:hypothetical protein